VEVSNPRSSRRDYGRMSLPSRRQRRASGSAGTGVTLQSGSLAVGSAIRYVWALIGAAGVRRSGGKCVEEADRNDLGREGLIDRRAGPSSRSSTPQIADYVSCMATRVQKISWQSVRNAPNHGAVVADELSLSCQALSARRNPRVSRESEGAAPGRPFLSLRFDWLRGLDLNQRPLGYEPNELPGCSTPR
jgi:hypothetical protein